MVKGFQIVHSCINIVFFIVLLRSKSVICPLLTFNNALIFYKNSKINTDEMRVVYPLPALIMVVILSIIGWYWMPPERMLVHSNITGFKWVYLSAHYRKWAQYQSMVFGLYVHHISYISYCCVMHRAITAVSGLTEQWRATCLDDCPAILTSHRILAFLTAGILSCLQEETCSCKYFTALSRSWCSHRYVLLECLNRTKPSMMLLILNISAYHVIESPIVSYIDNILPPVERPLFIWPSQAPPFPLSYICSKMFPFIVSHFHSPSLSESHLFNFTSHLPTAFEE